MAITFALRGDSFTPRFNGTGGPSYGLGGTAPTQGANASAIDGQALLLTSAAALGQQHVAYNGVGNWPSTRPVSVNISVDFPAAVSAHSLWYCGAPDSYASLECWIDGTNIVIRMTNELGQVGINNVGFAHGGITTDTFYDITVTFTGDNTSNGCEVFLDASSLGTTTSTRNWDNPRDDIHRHLGLGFGDVINNSYMEVQEFTIWDSVINPSSVTLTSGSGSLNGASRTAYVDVDQQDGAASAGGGSINLGPGRTGLFY